jgi:cell wall-associated NlpC family hydrolase
MIQTRDLIGKPFLYNARGPEEYDCWGLVRECWRRWHGQELPDYPSSTDPRINGDTVNDVTASAHWKRVEGAFPGTVVVMRVRQYGAHVGFVTSSTRVLHTLQGIGVTHSRLATYRRQIMGAYVYAA